MPGRRVFFSFHYQRDIWRVNVVRNSNVIEAQAAAGWQDASLWERTKKTGDAAIKKLIDEGLEGTSVTVVLIGKETAQRTYVNYEIEQSVKRGNGLLGVHINRIADQNGSTHWRGAVPRLLAKHGAHCHVYDAKRLGTWVERAAVAAGRPCAKHDVARCVLCWLFV